MVKQLNRLSAARSIDSGQVPAVVSAFRSIDAVLGIFCFEQACEDPRIQRLLDQRAAARRARDWPLADRLRQELAALGVTVRDEKLS